MSIRPKLGKTRLMLRRATISERAGPDLARALPHAPLRLLARAAAAAMAVEEPPPLYKPELFEPKKRLTILQHCYKEPWVPIGAPRTSRDARSPALPAYSRMRPTRAHALHLGPLS